MSVGLIISLALAVWGFALFRHGKASENSGEASSFCESGVAQTEVGADGSEG